MEGLALITSSGWASGLNLYAVAFLLGVFGRLGWATVPDQLTRTDVMVAAGIMYVLEFFADKIPYVDSIWDAIHTVVRPVGAAAIGFLVAGEVGTLGQAVAAVLAGGLAAASHTTKATTRAAVNTSPEPVSNIALSVVEDGLVAGVMALAIQFPVVAIVVVVVLLVAGLWVVSKLFGAVRRLLGRLAGAT